MRLYQIWLEGFGWCEYVIHTSVKKCKPIAFSILCEYISLCWEIETKYTDLRVRWVRNVDVSKLGTEWLEYQLTIEEREDLGLYVEED